MKRSLFLPALLVFCTSLLGAGTVMISYDLVLEPVPGLEDLDYVRTTGIDLETGVMDDLFDRGHIVFNHPGEVYGIGNPVPGGNRFQDSLSDLSRIAAEGGADTLIYLRLVFSGEREEDLALSSLMYRVFRLGDDQSVLADARLEYSRPGSPRINGREASHVLVSRFAAEDLF